MSHAAPIVIRVSPEILKVFGCMLSKVSLLSEGGRGVEEEHERGHV